MDLKRRYRNGQNDDDDGTMLECLVTDQLQVVRRPAKGGLDVCSPSKENPLDYCRAFVHVCFLIGLMASFNFMAVFSV